MITINPKCGRANRGHNRRGPNVFSVYLTSLDMCENGFSKIRTPRTCLFVFRRNRPSAWSTAIACSGRCMCSVSQTVRERNHRAAVNNQSTSDTAAARLNSRRRTKVPAVA